MSAVPVRPPETERMLGRADVELRVPASGAFASLLRTTAAGVAARLDLPIEDVEDLRIAVGEAAGVVLSAATDPTELVCGFHLLPTRLVVVVAAGCAEAVWPDREGFAWQVLTSLVAEVVVDRTAGRIAVSLAVAVPS